jgi:hypothetical protein
MKRGRRGPKAAAVDRARVKTTTMATTMAAAVPAAPAREDRAHAQERRHRRERYRMIPETFHVWALRRDVDSTVFPGIARTGTGRTWCLACKPQANLVATLPLALSG